MLSPEGGVPGVLSEACLDCTYRVGAGEKVQVSLRCPLVMSDWESVQILKWGHELEKRFLPLWSLHFLFLIPIISQACSKARVPSPFLSHGPFWPSGEAYGSLLRIF